MNTTLSLLYCPCPDQDSAQVLARWLIEQRLAACVNILPSVLSLSRDEKGVITETSECLLLAKTNKTCRPRIVQELPKQHPYQCPCVLFFDGDFANPAFATWVGSHTLAL
jgi:periplasmic divalent cation tolerance protein